MSDGGSLAVSDVLTLMVIDLEGRNTTFQRCEVRVVATFPQIFHWCAKNVFFVRLAVRDVLILARSRRSQYSFAKA